MLYIAEIEKLYRQAIAGPVSPSEQNQRIKHQAKLTLFRDKIKTELGRLNEWDDSTKNIQTLEGLKACLDAYFDNAFNMSFESLQLHCNYEFHIYKLINGKGFASRSAEIFRIEITNIFMRALTEEQDRLAPLASNKQKLAMHNLATRLTDLCLAYTTQIKELTIDVNMFVDQATHIIEEQVSSPLFQKTPLEKAWSAFINKLISCLADIKRFFIGKDSAQATPQTSLVNDPSSGMETLHSPRMIQLQLRSIKSQLATLSISLSDSSHATNLIKNIQDFIHLIDAMERVRKYPGTYNQRYTKEIADQVARFLTKIDQLSAACIQSFDSDDALQEKVSKIVSYIHPIYTDASTLMREHNRSDPLRPE